MTTVRAKNYFNIRSSIPRKSRLRQYDGPNLIRPRTFDQYRREVDELIERAYSLDEFGKKTQLSEACKKALIGGKRLRAIILLEIVRANAEQPIDAADVALFIEYVHTSSLIIDDLPAFDNDLTRRGRPSLHAEFGPAVAQMAAMSLLAAAFQNVCRQLDWVRDNCPEIKNVDQIGTLICNEVSRALSEASSGQYMDVSPPEILMKEHGPNAIIDITYRKTATFFELSTVIGWLISGGSLIHITTMRDIGRYIGVAFQIADDISDMARDASRAKPTWNIANEYGREVATQLVEQNLKNARILLEQTKCWTPLWDEIYSQIACSAACACGTSVTPVMTQALPESTYAVCGAASTSLNLPIPSQSAHLPSSYGVKA
ncbi:farnesyl diphosphate synthase-like [Hydra vulgaris]|uniref:Farnesyl diphosphate synthase-like n=1 Tax=Hydra vulgaris TaxID=6087 RepID=A0ABM4D1V1_HYDVU